MCVEKEIIDQSTVSECTFEAMRNDDFATERIM